MLEAQQTTLWTKLPLMETRMHTKIRFVPKTHSSDLTAPPMMIETPAPAEISPVVEGLSSPPSPKTPFCKNCVWIIQIDVKKIRFQVNWRRKIYLPDLG
jgi:hypothetical protein